MGKSIAIEGIIGAGKTTLLRALEKAYQIQAVHEPVDDNPYLERFYIKPRRHAFTMQMWLLARRHDANKAAYWLARAGLDVVVDRGRLGDRCFAQVNADLGNMSADELDLYEKYFRTMDARDPDAIVYIDITVSEAMRRIKERGRDCEKGIDPDYLNSLRSRHDLMVHGARARGVQIVKVLDDYDVEDVARALELTPRSL